MATISTHLRNFKEPTRDQLTQLFFSLPVDPQIEGPNEKSSSSNTAAGGDPERMEISATLSLGVSGVEEPYVSWPVRYDGDNGRLMNCCMLAREAIPYPAVPRFHFFGSEVCAVHDTAVHRP